MALQENERWSFGGYYLQRPHPDRGGCFYACRHETGSRKVFRRSLRTIDLEEAKRRLVELVAKAPLEDACDPDAVSLAHVMEAYLDGHAVRTRSYPYAVRSAQLLAEWLAATGKPAASVASFTPVQQKAFAEWLAAEKQNKGASVKRIFNVIRAALNDAAAMKLRPDPLGVLRECVILSQAPKIIHSLVGLAIPDPPPKVFVPTLDEMAALLDRLKKPHLRRWALLALSTWARPEAVQELTWGSFDRRTNTVALNPDYRFQTGKHRPTLPICRTLAGELEGWAIEDGLVLPGLAIVRYFGEPVARARSAIKRHARDLGLPVTPKTFRTFMATQVRALCPGVPREMRSVWLGHSVEAGSRTTDHYEVLSPDYLAPVALATDYVLAQLQKRCQNRLFAVDVQLTAAELETLKVAVRLEIQGGAPPEEKLAHSR